LNRLYAGKANRPANAGLFVVLETMINGSRVEPIQAIPHRMHLAGVQPHGDFDLAVEVEMAKLEVVRPQMPIAFKDSANQSRITAVI
jgi:hypothetical protein